MSNKQVKFVGVEEKLPIGQTAGLVLQHLIVGILAAIPVPLIIAGAGKLDSADTSYLINMVILSAGIATVLHSLGVIKFMSPKMPVVMGAAFSVIAAASLAFTSNMGDAAMGFRTLSGSVIIAGIFCLLVAKWWSKLLIFFPTIVVGCNITIIGVALIPNSFHWMNGYSGNASIEPRNLFMGLFVFALTVLFAKYLKGFLGSLSIMFALLVGSIVSAFFGFMDLAPVIEADWFGIAIPFKYGLPVFSLNVSVAFVIVMILVMVEISGTTMGVHSIAQMKMDESQLTKTMQSTGVSSILSGLFGAVQPTIFVQNLGLLDLSKVMSRYVTGAAGIGLIAISFFPKISALVNCIPLPVLGGAGFAIFGIVMAAGIKILQSVEFDGNNNMMIVALSVGVAMIPAVYPDFYGKFPEIINTVFSSGIIAGSLTAIILNIFFNNPLSKKNKK